MPGIAIHGTCEARFSRVRALFQSCLDSGSEIGAAVAFVLDGESVVDLWGVDILPRLKRGIPTALFRQHGAAPESLR